MTVSRTSNCNFTLHPNRGWQEVGSDQCPSSSSVQDQVLNRFSFHKASSDDLFVGVEGRLSHHSRKRFVRHRTDWDC